jgi:hypothetical protein
MNKKSLCDGYCTQQSTNIGLGDCLAPLWERGEGCRTVQCSASARSMGGIGMTTTDAMGH